MKKKVEPKLKFKGQTEFRHDLFKASVQKMKKNTSFVFGRPSILELEHTHVFHSYDSKGRPQKFTSTTGGHFHEIQHGVDDEGNVYAKCGPALQTVVRKGSGGRQIKKIGPIVWKDVDNEVEINDNHTHQMTYISSEFLTEQIIGEMQNRNRAGVKAQMGNAQPTITSPTPVEGFHTDND